MDNSFDTTITDPTDYRVYMTLGDQFRDTNPDKAYLSYENALYHCIRNNGSDSNDSDVIIRDLSYLKMTGNIHVRNVSFVILSYNEFDHTRNCIESIRKTCPRDCCEIIVIDNSSTDGSVEWLREQTDITLIENKENVGFPAGCNQGINASAPENDIFLLNNDTILMPNSLFWLRMGLYENNSVGATGAVTNSLSRDQVVESSCTTIEEFEQFSKSINIPCDNPYEKKLYLVMFAMLIKRTALDDTGLLDELYTPGNFEDNDYGIRLTQNGYNCVLCHNAFIYHVGSASFGKDVRKYNSLYQTNYSKFKNKWGFSSDEYSTVRNDLIDMIELDRNAVFSVLEMGCGFGETLTKIQYLYPNSTIRGIESNRTIADITSNRLDIVCEDPEDHIPEGTYDFIVIADILESVNDPGKFLMDLREHLSDNGYILLSVTNTMNAERIYNKLTGNDQSDVTQKHQFTINNIQTLAKESGYIISDLYTTSLPGKTTDDHKEFFDNILKTEGPESKELFDIYQFLLKLHSSHEF